MRPSRSDAYFSVDVETDGPIPGPYSMLSFAMVYAGGFDGVTYRRPASFQTTLYRELAPISDAFEPEALSVNGLDRERLIRHGASPRETMTEAANWVRRVAGDACPVLVAFPLSFDWHFLYWYFVRYSATGSPFAHSHCFDVKTAWAVKAGVPLSEAGRSRIAPHLTAHGVHTHHALDDAIAQAELFANVFEWGGTHGFAAGQERKIS